MTTFKIIYAKNNAERIAAGVELCAIPDYICDAENEDSARKMGEIAAKLWIKKLMSGVRDLGICVPNHFQIEAINAL